MPYTPRPLCVALAALAVLACSACSSPPADLQAGAVSAPAPETRRMLAGGEVVGFEAPGGAHVWLGLPFARPPVGPLRWRAPRAPVPWSGVREALRFGPPCPQFANRLGGVAAEPGTPVGREDCLYLNVYAPASAAEAVAEGAARLPVMVWIHGGGNTIGHTGFYDGATLAVTEKVVVVTVTYRLGPFGWFRHAALAGADADPGGFDRSGNFGTLDQIRALEWVRENAAAFGGDPGNVTIFGESAGGTNVLVLLASPAARGLFHRAIAQSGGTVTAAPAEGENPSDAGEPGHPNSSAEVLLRLLVSAGVAEDREAARTRRATMTPQQVEKFLRGRDTGAILSVYAEDLFEGMADLPMLFRDGTVLPRYELGEVFARGEHADVPVMLGTNRDEMKLFYFADPQRIRYAFGLPLWRRDPSWYELSAEYTSRMWRATGADEPAERLAAAQQSPVFVYRFDWDEEPRVLWSDLSVLLGAAHGFEIPFVFGHFDLGRAGNAIFTEENLPGRLELSGRMMSYWAEFARRGDPGQGGDGRLVRWEPWRADGPATLIFDTDAGGGLRHVRERTRAAALVAAVESDPRLAEPTEQCRMYAELARFGRDVEPAQYAAGQCESPPVALGAAR